MSATGIIVCVKGISTQAKVIQKFQMRRDEVAGRWNHTGLIYQSPYDFYLFEQAPIKDRKLKANSNMTHLQHYTGQVVDGLELLYLIPAFEYNPYYMELLLVEYSGIPYDYTSLLKYQVVRTLFNLWTGRIGKNASKRMVCHEFVMFIWNEYTKRYLGFEIFPGWATGNVELMFYSAYFMHEVTLPNPFLKP